ncbi:MAG TPA: histidine phosphatase family protein [Blastocatellia bacterium]|nr:histidine phosphatase family protein [Blastocatellia bacterium]
MSYVYFIRHAQAGSRDNYDLLSDLGKQQARLLGQHMAEHGIDLDAVFCGDMRRQRETAEIATEELARSGHGPRDVTVDNRWNEFSLISVYRAIAGRMMAENPEFECDYKEMQDMVRRDPHATGGATGRCDAAIIRAWIENRYPDYDGESWMAFKARVQACSRDLQLKEYPRAVAVFTSATPVAIQAAIALGIPDERLLSILGVIYNSSVTVIRSRDPEPRLFTFNATPHLKPSQRTFR